MLKNMSGEYTELLETPKYFPCISLIMPFEPKMGLKVELAHKLKMATDKIENELTANYPDEKIKPVLKKLKNVISELNYNTHKKSIAIFVSPLIEKVYYLDIPVEERVVIDESFEIRDLIYSKKQIHKYLLAVLSAKWAKVYLGNTNQFIRVSYTEPDNAAAITNEIAEKTANFSDESKRKEILLDKFLRHTDNGLSLLLQAYNLPLFIMGTVRTVGHFKKITHNTKSVIEYIHGNFEEKSAAELRNKMEPYISDWKKVIQTDLLKKLDDAMGHKKLVVGIDEVWKAAAEKKARLLVVEKNFIYPAEQSSVPGKIFKHDANAKNAFYIKDAVDDVIEKVLASGGDVEFVDEGLLSEYQKIALIEYYQ